MQKYWKEILQTVENGEFDPTLILSHRFSMEEFSELYDAFDEKAHGILKRFVQTRFSGKPAKGTLELSSFRSGDMKLSAVANEYWLWQRRVNHAEDEESVACYVAGQ